MTSKLQHLCAFVGCVPSMHGHTVTQVAQQWKSEAGVWHVSCLQHYWNSKRRGNRARVRTQQNHQLWHQSQETLFWVVTHAEYKQWSAKSQLSDITARPAGQGTHQLTEHPKRAERLSCLCSPPRFHTGTFSDRKWPTVRGRKLVEHNKSCAKKSPFLWNFDFHMNYFKLLAA